MSVAALIGNFESTSRVNRLILLSSSFFRSTCASPCGRTYEQGTGDQSQQSDRSENYTQLFLIAISTHQAVDHADKEQEIKQRAWSFLKLHSDIWDFFVTRPPLNFLKCLSLPPLMIGKVKLLWCVFLKLPNSLPSWHSVQSTKKMIIGRFFEILAFCTCLPSWHTAQSRR